MAVHFHYLVPPFRFPHRRQLKTFIAKLFAHEHTPLDSLDVIFCSDEHLLQMNRDHLEHDYYTDIITFPLHEDEAPVIGELYISVDRVRENAHSLKTPFLTELHRVIFHGCLHLCGYTDKVDSEVMVMRSKEDEALTGYSKLISRHRST